MSYKEPRTIDEIVATINLAIKQTAAKPVNDVASYIVGATWAIDTDIMDFALEYPELITVADLASDIEMMQRDDDYRRELWSELLENFKKLKERIDVVEASGDSI